MRCLYREKIYKCGDYLEIDIFPTYKKQNSRGKRGKPTTEVQKKLNAHNSEKKLLRLINANFTSDDIKAELTYKPGNEPQTDEEALKDSQNFIRRLKRLRNKKGLPELKYITVIERGERSGRYHLHIVISGGITPGELAKVWGLGYVMKIQPLQFDNTGVAGIAFYMSGNKRGQKIEPLLYRRYNASKNLIIPQPTERDGKLSQKRVKELATVDSESHAAFENIYDGYFFADCKPFYNDYNGGYYLCVRMYRKETKLSNGNARKRANERSRKNGKHNK